MKVGTDGVLLGAWANVAKAKRILDVGTGTGVIALILAQRSLPTAHIDAIDIAEDAFDLATENVLQAPWPDKVAVHQKSFQNFNALPYDMIVSNPPYFNKSYKPPKALRTQARHTDTLSHEVLLQNAKRLLASDGNLNLILPEAEGNQLLAHAIETGWSCSRLCRFRSRKEKPVERLLIEFQFTPSETIEEELTLYENGETWSTGYQNLTHELYLKL